MIEQKQHLSQILDQQRTLASEIQEINISLNIKKEQYLKLQGVIEYLNANGVHIETPKSIKKEGIQE